MEVVLVDDELKIALNEREKAQVIAAVGLAALGGIIPNSDAWDIVNAIAASYPEDGRPVNLYPIDGDRDRDNGR